MYFDDVMVLFRLLRFLVVISNAFLKVWHVRVAGPLPCCWEDECVPNFFVVLFAGAGSLACTLEGTTLQLKRRLFDCTMGYPGEDVRA